MRLAEIETPALTIEHDIVRRNIDRMSDVARNARVALRPHAKTHKLPQIAAWQAGAGAVGITVAKVSEAEVMAAAGQEDIFIANQIVSRAKLARLAALSRRIRIVVGVDSDDGARLLSRAAVEESVELRVRIEVDTGLYRCGLPPGEPVVELARCIRDLPGLLLDGIFTPAGHVYGARSFEERDTIGRQEGELMAETALRLEAAGFRAICVSVGSTPTARMAAAVPGVTEIRPGNYVFHDAMQVGLGVATWDDCALRVVATMISRPDTRRAVVDAGSKALGTERGRELSTVRGHGHVLEYPEATLDRLSEEHGVMVFESGDAMPCIGERVTIVPAHACYSMNLFERVALVDGGQVLDLWPVAARGKSE